MATKDLLEKHFKCPICQDQLSTPRRLNCGHAYCHDCLDDLIRAKTDYYWIRRGTAQLFGFPCPECRKIMKIPRPDEPCGRWVHQFNKDFKLDGILADLKDIAYELDWEERQEQETEILPEINIKTGKQVLQDKASVDLTIEVSAIEDDTNWENTSGQVEERAVEAELEDREKNDKESFPEENENTPPQTRPEVEENTSINSNTGVSERMPEIHTNTKLQVDKEDASIGLTIGLSIIADDTMPETESEQVEENGFELYERGKKENERLAEENDIQTNFTTPEIEANASIDSTMEAADIRGKSIMATKDLLEKHFKCPICQDQLSTPRRLNCGHAYCHDCLDDLIRAKTDYYWIRRGTAQLFGFPCPECRKIMKIPRPDEPCGRWVHQFNKDFKLDGILADLKDIAYELDWEERQEQETEILPEINIKTGKQVLQDKASVDLTIEVSAIEDDTNWENTSGQVEERAVEAELEDREKNDKESFPEENENTSPQTRPEVEENTSINSNTGVSERLPEENEKTPPQTRPGVEEKTSINSNTGVSERLPEENEKTPPQTRPEVEENTSINSNTGVSERMPEIHTNTKLQVDQGDASIGLTIGLSIIADDTMPESESEQVEENGFEDELYEREKKENERLMEESEIQTNFTTPKVEETASIDSTMGAAAIAAIPETDLEQVEGIKAEDELYEREKKENERLVEENDIQTNFTTPEVEETASIDSTMGAAAIAGHAIPETTSKQMQVLIPIANAVEGVVAADKKKKKETESLLEFLKVLTPVDQVDSLDFSPVVRLNTTDFLPQALADAKKLLKIGINDKVKPHDFAESIKLVQKGGSATTVSGLVVKEGIDENIKNRCLNLSTEACSYQGSWIGNERGGHLNSCLDFSQYRETCENQGACTVNELG